MNDKTLIDTIARRLEAARNLDKAFADAGVAYAQYFNAGCALKDHYLPLGIPVFRIESQPRLAVALRCVARPCPATWASAECRSSARPLWSPPKLNSGLALRRTCKCASPGIAPPCAPIQSPFY